MNKQDLDKALELLNRYNKNKTKRFIIDNAYGYNNLRYGNEGTEKDISLGNTKTELYHQIHTTLKIFDVIKESE